MYLTLTTRTLEGCGEDCPYPLCMQGSVVEAAGSVQWAALPVTVAAGYCWDMPVGDIC